jgi:hypothetical protein
VLKHYGGSHVRALMALYPNIGLVARRFLKVASMLKNFPQFPITFRFTHCKQTIFTILASTAGFFSMIIAESMVLIP